MSTRKIIGSISDYVCSQTQMARALNISQPRINQLINEGIVIRDESSRSGQVMLLESVQNYYLSKNATGDNVNFWKERGLHERAKRELAELKLSKSRGEVYAAAVVEGVLAELLTTLRNRLTGLPSKLALQLEYKSRGEIYTVLTAAIEDELSELSAGVDTSDFADEEAIADEAVEKSAPCTESERE